LDDDDDDDDSLLKALHGLPSSTWPQDDDNSISACTRQQVGTDAAAEAPR